MNEMNIPRCFYRVSTKALVINDKKQIILIQEKDGSWELPGGGLEYDTDFSDNLRKEIKEEIGVETLEIGKKPIYVWTGLSKKGHCLLLGYQVKLKSDKFTKSDECYDFKYFSKENLKKIKLHPNLLKFPDIFNPDDFGVDWEI